MGYVMPRILTKGRTGLGSMDLAEDRYIDVGAVRTRYWQGGKSGSVVVLIHGLGGYIENWGYLFHELTQHYRVYAFDLIGFGKSDKPDGEYTYRFFADFTYRLFQSLNIAGASVVGWSLGGGTALQFAIDHPGKVEKLILIGSGGLSRKFSLQLRLLTVPILGELLLPTNSGKNRKAYRALVYDTDIIQDEWMALDASMAKVPGIRRTILKTLRAGSTVFGGKSSVLHPIISNLENIDAETLVIWGRNDRIVPFKCSEIAIDAIPKTKLFSLDKCGHTPFLEYPQRVAAAVISFLGSS